MNTLTSTALQFTDQVQRLSTVIGLLKSSPQDRLFLVMGKTGSGKSTFIARCTGVDVTVGHGLYSCTCTSHSVPLQSIFQSSPLRWFRLVSSSRAMRLGDPAPRNPNPTEPIHTNPTCRCPH
ncbi:hypothetical protein BJY04DRAFT_184966 [Aspergillus karnatakaensis]|uniref:uncharacterized protein n=1 Tax=Aspergillus karnatakaensis TaxID=1810916 RepID=UPI003CCD5037